MELITIAHTIMAITIFKNKNKKKLSVFLYGVYRVKLILPRIVYELEIQ